MEDPPLNSITMKNDHPSQSELGLTLTALRPVLCRLLGAYIYDIIFSCEGRRLYKSIYLSRLSIYTMLL